MCSKGMIMTKASCSSASRNHGDALHELVVARSRTPLLAIHQSTAREVLGHPDHGLVLRRGHAPLLVHLQQGLVHGPTHALERAHLLFEHVLRLQVVVQVRLEELPKPQVVPGRTGDHLSAQVWEP